MAEHLWGGLRTLLRLHYRTVSSTQFSCLPFPSTGISVKNSLFREICCMATSIWVCKEFTAIKESQIHIPFIWTFCLFPHSISLHIRNFNIYLFRTQIFPTLGFNCNTSEKLKWKMKNLNSKLIPDGKFIGFSSGFSLWLTWSKPQISFLLLWEIRALLSFYDLLCLHL